MNAQTKLSRSGQRESPTRPPAEMYGCWLAAYLDWLRLYSLARRHIIQASHVQYAVLPGTIPWLPSQPSLNCVQCYTCDQKYRLSQSFCCSWYHLATQYVHTYVAIYFNTLRVLPYHACPKARGFIKLCFRLGPGHSFFFRLFFFLLSLVDRTFFRVVISPQPNLSAVAWLLVAFIV